MGWKSTIDLTREEAEQIVRDLDIENLNDYDLAEVIEALRGGCEHGHNYRIIPKEIE